jgi:hypothetical protein
LGARVAASVRRMVLHLPASFPFLPAFRHVALALRDATDSMRSAAKQLGLELKPTTGPMDGMVIDHIERPPLD